MSGFLGGGIGPAALKRRRAAADWWEVAGQTCVAAYQPIGAASLAASYVNLANPGTYDAAPGVAPTLAAGGWQGGGGAYLTTGIVPTNNQQWSMIVMFSGGASTNQYMIGARTGSIYFSIAPRWMDSKAYYGSGAELAVASGPTSGVVAIAGMTAYRNGAAEPGIISAVAGSQLSSIYMLAANGNGAPANAFFGTIAAVAIYKPTEPSTTPMSAADVAALTTRMQALA